MASKDRMPTLYEVLNRFSLPPVDLWSFYVFLNDQYGGSEYLEFWLEAARFKALCREYGKLKYARSSNRHSNPSEAHRLRSSGGGGMMTPIVHRGSNQAGPWSPSSSMLFDMLHDDVLDSSFENFDEENDIGISNRPPIHHESESHQNSSSHTGSHHHSSGSNRHSGGSHQHSGSNPDSNNSNRHGSGSRSRSGSSNRHRGSPQQGHGQTQSSDSVYSAVESLSSGLSQAQDPVPGQAAGQVGSGPQYTSVPSRADASSPAKETNRRQAGAPNTTTTGAGNRFSQGSVSRLSAFLDEFHQKRKSGNSDNLDENQKPQLSASRGTGNDLDDLGISGGATAYAPVKQTPMPMNLVSDNNDFTIDKLQIGTAVTRKDIHEDAERIIATYLTPGSVRELVLPTDATGWSMSAAIRQGAGLPGGLDNPKIFDEATSYVFTILEREAYPSFLYSRALANVQPLSSSLRMAFGLLAVFGAFWLGFVFILLNWSPKSHRCWVILPFGFGWYLVFSSLYRLDPVLGLLGFSENDQSLGLEKISEPYIRKLIVKRSTFILVATVAISAAFCVIFIFVPGYHL